MDTRQEKRSQCENPDLGWVVEQCLREREKNDWEGIL